ncbi:uncharacterized protein LOC123894699 isoform X1 [Trifolium pratense]|uniref:Uncharacterized protein n=1 Tax=Trifolium pratense TaxID=57577 RepID=A0ACB0KZ82_TRIPR|nr:uncharacterized protein LOC123894699 isoform X1 [Trifolium pratense]CAJ2660482.1 unnamed protein product [Trifolium pratense]
MATTLLSSNPWTRRVFFLFPRNKTQILTTHHCCNPTTEMNNNDAAVVSLQEWQGWGTTSPVPAMVTQIAEDLKLLEKDFDSQMKFGRAGGKLQGNIGQQEDKKHRATYKALPDSEEKLKFFSARQIACRVIGSKGYLCQKCWLPMEEDCMCSQITSCLLFPGIRFWLYMHPKDFLRQNNTGKLLWQIFGVDAATLCLFGIPEHEQIMWNSLKLAGRSNVWCLYPNKNAVLESVENAFGQEPDANNEVTSEKQLKVDTTQHFILIDGTWSNSAAMFRRLQDHAKSIWGDEDLSCISLNPGTSAMHKLRPQPSWDRTCTAAAAAGLLLELQLLPRFSSIGLDKQSEAIEHALTILLDALTKRRLRMGRSITRKVRPNKEVINPNEI